MPIQNLMKQHSDSNNTITLASTIIDNPQGYGRLKKENAILKNNVTRLDYLELENTQLRKLIEEQVSSSSNLLSARVMLDKQSPYLNSFIINVGIKLIKLGLKFK